MKSTKKNELPLCVRLILAGLVTIFLTSCGNNLHYTLGLNTLSVDFGIPSIITSGQTVSLSGGSCSPNGSGNITLDSSPTGDFTPAPLTCDCVNGAITNCVDSGSSPVTSISFPGSGPNGPTPNLVTTITDDEGNTQTSNPETVINPEIDLTGPTSAVAGGAPAPLNATGTCSYAGSNPTANVTITDSSGSMSPSSITCVCNGPGAGTLDCSGAGNVSFSSSDPNLVASIDDGVSTLSDDTPVAVNIDPVVDLNSPSGAPFNVGDNIPLTGSCQSDGDSISIPNPGPGNITPTGPLTCSCGASASGQFDCGSYQLTAFGTSPNFTATVTDSDGDSTSDSELATTVGPSLMVTKALSRINGSVVASGADVFAGDVLEFSVGVTNSGMGVATNVQISDGCPANAPANGTFNDGTGTYVSGTWTVPTLTASGGSDTLTFECVVSSGLSSGSVNNTITSVASNETGSTTVAGVSTSNPIVSPSVDLTNGPSPSGPNVATTLPSNMGTCAPNGGSISLSDANGSMTASPVTCTCNSGAIDCSANSVTFTSEDPNLAATVTANGVGPVADATPGNDPAVVISPTLTIDDLDSGGTLTDGDTFSLSGTCQSDGDVLNIPNPGPGDLYTWPASASNGSCTCSSGSFNCGTVTVADASQGPSSTVTATITDQDGSAPNETASASDTPMVASPGFTLVKSVSPTGNIYAGSTVTYTLSLTNGSVPTTSVSLDDDCPSPMTATGSPSPSTGTYTGGTWSIGSMAVSANETLSFDCQVPNGTSAQTVTNSVTTVAANGSSYTPGGTTSVSNDIVDPTVDLTTGPSPSGPNVATTLPSNMGTCAPNGGSVSLSDANGSMVSSPVTCTCNSGAIDCSANSVTFTSEDPNLAATVTANGVGPIADATPGNDPVVVMSPTVTINDPNAGPYGPSENIPVSGNCESAGDSVVVTASPSSDLSSSSVSCSCLGTPGSYTCPNFTTNASGAGATVTFTATVTDQDGSAPNETSSASMTEDIFCPTSPPITYASKSTFNYTGSDQDFNMPASFCWMKVKVWGAGGAGDSQAGGSRGRGGSGGYSEFIFDPTAIAGLPAVLKVVVGEGGKSNSLVRTYGEGGAGGDRASSSRNGSSGGGLSGVFRVSFSTGMSMSDIISIGAGGGGSGAFNSASDFGGSGGGLNGDDGDSTGGGGASQIAGGSADGGGNTGGFLLGGDGGDGPIGLLNNGGGGGGGGLFGGGGGGHTDDEKCGGGGSSFVDSAIAESGTVVLTQGTDSTPPNQGDPDYVVGSGVGGPQQTDGGNGLVIIEWD